MTVKNYYEFSTSLEGLWNAWQRMFPSGSKELEDSIESWRKITKVIEDYREANCDFPCWQDEWWDKFEHKVDGYIKVDLDEVEAYLKKESNEV